MSWEAVAWAMKQPVGHSSAKFVLVAIAERAGKENIAWPSVTALVEATCQNRKTVLSNIQRLIEMGYIIDTGERTGATKSVVVYKLNEPESSPKINPAKQSQNLPKAVPKSTPLSDTDIGTSCGGEAVPKSTRSSPKKLLKQSQKVPEAVPKSSTEPTRTDHIGTDQNQPTRDGRELPDWLPIDSWQMWDRFRKKKSAKAWTDDAKQLSLRKLNQLRDEGHDPTEVIEQSIERGWTGLFPVKTNTPFGRPAPKTENFKEKTYVGTDESAISWA